MKAFISSESPVKHSAVGAAFASFDRTIETVATPQSSSVNEQPKSIGETHEGAENRHNRLVEAIGKKANGNFLITIESGVAELIPGRGEYGVEVVIVEKDGDRKVGVGSDLEFPAEMTDKVPSVYADLGVLVQAEYGAKTKDPYPYFTFGRVTRDVLIQRALTDVLAQFEVLSQNDIEALGDYAEYIKTAEDVLRQKGVGSHELVQCDMVNYECPTNERYDEMMLELQKQARLLNETTHGGRLISIFRADPQLRAGDRRVPYIELLQPKPTRDNIDGIDGIFFVTVDELPVFVAKHPKLKFDTKGLANNHNPYVELKTEGVSVKFHDRHMGAVLGMEKRIDQPTYGGHVTL